MPDIENRLRAELKHVAQQVQPEALRPLRVPASRRGWRPRLLPLAAAAAVIAIIAVVGMVTGLPASHQPPRRASTSRFATSPSAKVAKARRRSSERPPAARSPAR